MRRINSLDLLCIVALAAFFLWFFRQLPSPGPYIYDEADYITAGSSGLAANFLEKPSMSIVEFLKTGLERRHLTQRSSLSEIVRGSHDVTFYRHYHGPIYYYWLAIAGAATHFNEYAMRWSGFVWHLLTFAAIFVGMKWFTASRAAAAFASALYLFGQANLGTAMQITPHIPYVFFTVLALLLFAAYLETGALRLWYGAVAAFACAFCSIDYAILIAITFAACLLLIRERRIAPGALGRSVLLFLGILAVLWPIGLFELSAIKGYFYIAYLAMQRKGSYGDYGPFTIWVARVQGAPVEYGLDIAALAFCIYAWRKESMRRYRPLLLPCLIYAALMMLTTLKNTSLNWTYMSSILPPLAVVSGVVFAVATASLAVPARAAVAAVLVALAVVGAWPMVTRAEQFPKTSPERNAMAALHDAGMDTSEVLVPYEILPTISYYYPGVRLHPYLMTDDAATIIDKLRGFNIRGFLYRARPGDDLPEKLGQQFHVSSTPVDMPGGATLYRIDGTS
jgi:hypothetical protein